MEGESKRKSSVNPTVESNLDSSGSDLDFEDSGSSVRIYDTESGSSEFSEVIDLQDIANVEVSDNEIWIDIEPEKNDIVFTGAEEILIDLPSNAEPIQYFSQMFDDDLVAKIVTWTNARAKLIYAHKRLRAKSNFNRWKDTTSLEIKQVLALCLLMPLNKKPTVQNYWSKRELYVQNIFGQTMGRIRFENVLRSMCFYDETNVDRSTRLYKIQNVVNHILNNIKNIYRPPENLSLDEALLLWRGRLSFRQYIPNKRHKYGIKFYELCTPDGFLINMLIYTGKGTVSNEHGHSYGVVKELMKEYLGKGHTLYMDNYYCSVDLAEFLVDSKTNMCGTLRANRKRNPSYVIKRKLKKGEIAWRRNFKNIIVMKWKDKRDVLMISSKHNADIVNLKTKRNTEVTKPKIVADYNAYMSGIDRADQMISYYACPRRSIRWYMKVFFHLLDICIWNSCWIYNKINLDRNLSLLEFREKIIKSYLGQPSAQQSNSSSIMGHPIVGNNPTMGHFPSVVKSRKRCRQCSKSGKRTATKYVCCVCKSNEGEEIGLCAYPCFSIWHTE